ncbi:MAG: hypothetical protein ACLQM8_26765, partial [Limisphaerales bacterium]
GTAGRASCVRISFVFQSSGDYARERAADQTIPTDKSWRRRSLGNRGGRKPAEPETLIWRSQNQGQEMETAEYAEKGPHRPGFPRIPRCNSRDCPQTAKIFSTTDFADGTDRRNPC